MGVPAFYRWLVSRYPKIVLNNIENTSSSTSNDHDSSKPQRNPYDNLYIDMNGLIHPCSHPEDRPPPSSVQEIYENIGKYLERLFNAIQPQRLLFLSIDGVAPRAKMNQQRSRRYRTAQDKLQRDSITKQVLDELFPDVTLPPITAWDSNVITPGTEFMTSLSDYLHHFIQDKMKNDEKWKKIKIILSDASVCGEGEHKIMSFIRSQRNQDGYDPNQHHVIHGLDADLIMLALGTHEPKFSILREEQLSPYEKKKEKQRLSRAKQSANDDDGNDDEPLSTSSITSDSWIYSQKLLCLRIEYLREYLSSEYSDLQESLGQRYDLERIIDDIIFLCYFVGNDFLPHLPTLEIREGGIDLLLNAYKVLLPSWEDYLTSSLDNGERVIHTTQLAGILRRVTENEHETLVSKENEERKLEDLAATADDGPISSGSTSGHGKQSRQAWKSIDDIHDPNDNSVAEIMKIVKEEVDRRIAELDKHAANDQRRKLRGRIHGDTPKDRYYNNPFRTKDLVDGKGLDKMCSSYLDGLCWVLNYYLQGPPSWKWFYPFHYSPCASDLLAAIENLSSTTHSITYHHDYSSPLKPVEQLLCVLPAESAAALPVACRGLMTSKSSPLSDIYHPQDVITDRGNPMSWLWIILLPFIDVNRIIRAAKECEPLFTPEETLRNTYGTAFLYVNSLQCNNIASSIDENLLANETSPKDDLRDCLSSNIRTDGEVVVYPLYGFVSHSPIYEGGYSSEDGDADHDDDEEESERILCFQYFLPTETIHRSALIEGIQPLGSPLDLKSNRKKNNRFRGGGRSRGRGGRGSRGRSDHRSHGDVRGGEGHDVSEFHEGGNRKNGRGGGRGSNHSHPHSSHHQG